MLVPASNSAFSSVHPAGLVGGSAADGLGIGFGIPSLVRATASSRDTLNEVVNANFVADESAGAAFDGEDDFFDDDEADRESDYYTGSPTLPPKWPHLAFADEATLIARFSPSTAFIYVFPYKYEIDHCRSLFINIHSR